MIEFVTEYNLQCCSESRRHIYDKEDNIYNQAHVMEEDAATGMINILKNL